MIAKTVQKDILSSGYLVLHSEIEALMINVAVDEEITHTTRDGVHHTKKVITTGWGQEKITSAEQVFNYNFDIDPRFTDFTTDEKDPRTPTNKLWIYSPHTDGTFRETVESTNIDPSQLYYHRKQIISICYHRKQQLRAWGSNVFIIKIADNTYAFMEVTIHKKGLEIIYRDYNYNMSRPASTKPLYFLPRLLKN